MDLVEGGPQPIIASDRTGVCHREPNALVSEPRATYQHDGHVQGHLGSPDEARRRADALVHLLVRVLAFQERRLQVRRSFTQNRHVNLDEIAHVL